VASKETHVPVVDWSTLIPRCEVEAQNAFTRNHVLPIDELPRSALYAIDVFACVLSRVMLSPIVPAAVEAQIVSPTPVQDVPVAVAPHEKLAGVCQVACVESVAIRT